jgi:hypothetical protein
MACYKIRDFHQNQKTILTLPLGPQGGSYVQSPPFLAVNQNNLDGGALESLDRAQAAKTAA